jgi:hypothetical protein
MMVARSNWQQFEEDVQQLLGLDSNPGSGNQFNAPGDAVDNRHPNQTSWPIIADCKHTTKYSYSVKFEVLQEWEEKATEMGKRFIMPLRFQLPRAPAADYVLMPLHDFVELIDQIRETDGP